MKTIKINSVLKSLLFLGILSVSAPATAGPLCLDIFVSQKLPPLSNPSVIPLSNEDPKLRVDPVTMAQLITGVAQNDLYFSDFSPDLMNQLRRTLEIQLFSEKLGEAAAFPYYKELIRRSGGGAVKFSDLHGYDIDLATHGISQPQISKNIKTLDEDKIIDRVRKIFRKTDAEYKRRMFREDFYLDIGLSRSFVNPIKGSVQQTASTFDLFSEQRDLDAEAVYWMFATFLREKEVRYQIEELAEQNLKTLKTLQQKNRLIMLIAAYPELLPLFESLPLLDFNPHIHFRLIDIPLETSYSRVKGLRGLLANFFVEKEVRSRRAGTFEGLSRAGISLLAENSGQETVLPSLNNRAPQISKVVGKAWTKFSELNKDRVSGLKFDVEVEEESIEFILKFELGAQPPVDVLADFYLFMTEPEKRDEFGRLYIRTTTGDLKGRAAEEF